VATASATAMASASATATALLPQLHGGGNFQKIGILQIHEILTS
jgi:hypothetical protein